MRQDAPRRKSKATLAAVLSGIAVIALFLGYSRLIAGPRDVCRSVREKIAGDEYVNPNKPGVPYTEAQTVMELGGHAVYGACPNGGRFLIVPQDGGHVKVECSFPGHADVWR